MEEREAVREGPQDNRNNSGFRCQEETRKLDSKEWDRKRNNDQSYEYSISDNASTKIMDVEHNSRKSNYLQTNKDFPAESRTGKISRSYDSGVEANNAEPNTFLSRSKESIYETSGSAPVNTERYNKELIFNKELIKNSAAVKCKVPKPEQRDASPTIDLLQRSFESLQSALNNKETELQICKLLFALTWFKLIETQHLLLLQS